VEEAEPHAGVVSQADRPFDSGGEKDRLLISGFLAPRPAISMALLRLYRRGLQNRDPGGGLRKGFVPPGRGAKSGKKFVRLFADYVTARLPADCRCEFTDHSNAPAIALDWNIEAAGGRQARADRGVGQGSAC